MLYRRDFGQQWSAVSTTSRGSLLVRASSGSDRTVSHRVDVRRVHSIIANNNSSISGNGGSKARAPKEHSTSTLDALNRVTGWLTDDSISHVARRTSASDDSKAAKSDQAEAINRLEPEPIFAADNTQSYVVASTIPTLAPLLPVVLVAASLLLCPLAGVRPDVVLSADLEAALFIVTSLFQCRFLMSCFPRLERVRKNRQPWTAIADASDPILVPVRKLMNHKDGDLDTSAAAMVAVTVIVQELLFGSTGVLLREFQQPAVQTGLQLVLLLQEGMLLPVWLLAVFKWMAII